MPEIRLHKFIADCGAASRRHAEDLIRNGRVRLNGQVVLEQGVKCDPTADCVELNGRRLRLPESFVYIMYHKPRGVTTTRFDPHAETTLFDALPQRWRRLKPVGRLDKWSEGLLLLTNHGELIHRLTHPAFGEEKEYVVEVNGAPPPGGFARLERGVQLEKIKTRPAVVSRVEKLAEFTRFHITLREGRKRQIRRMCEAVGCTVRRLKRIRTGPLELGNLPLGKCRELSKSEIEALLQLLL